MLVSLRLVLLTEDLMLVHLQMLRDLKNVMVAIAAAVNALNKLMTFSVVVLATEDLALLAKNTHAHLAKKTHALLSKNVQRRERRVIIQEAARPRKRRARRSLGLLKSAHAQSKRSGARRGRSGQNQAGLLRAVPLHAAIKATESHILIRDLAVERRGIGLRRVAIKNSEERSTVLNHALIFQIKRAL